MGGFMNRPLEQDYTSLAAYTRALEEYCEALAQPEPTGQAPCARHCESTAYEIVICGLKGDIERMKATQRTWVGLTDDKRNAIGRHHAYVFEIIKATEAELRSQNEY